MLIGNVFSPIGNGPASIVSRELDGFLLQLAAWNVSLLANAIKFGCRSDQQFALADSRRCEAKFIQVVDLFDFKFRTRFENEGLAVLREAEDLPIVGPRRGRE